MMAPFGSSQAFEPVEAPPSPIPAQYAVYEVFYNDRVVGEVDFLLEQANAVVWHVRMQSRPTSFLAKTFGSEITQASHFYWRQDPNGITLVPLTYHHVSREPLRTRYWQHRFDWESQTSDTLTHEGEQVIPLKEGLLDPLTLRLQLASDLMHSDPTLPKRDYWVLDRDDVESQKVEYRGATLLRVPAGCFNTHHLYRLRKEGSARNYDLWVSSDFYYLPIQTIQSDGQREIRMALKETSLSLDALDCGD
jgi:hypothetical protein